MACHAPTREDENVRKHTPPHFTPRPRAGLPIGSLRSIAHGAPFLFFSR